MEDKYKLYNGDCLSVMEEMIEQGVKVDVVITDPPYGMDFKSNRRKNKYDKIKNDDTLDFLDEYFNKCNEIMEDNSHIYCFCSWHHIDVFKKSFENNFKLKNIIVWEKNVHGTGDLKGSFAPKHEFILFGHKGRKLLNGKRIPDIIQAKKTGNKLHPTQKPVDLIELFIEKSTNENDVVFDEFSGSGSTGVACLNKNRKFIGVELDEGYYNVSKERIESIIEND